MFSKKKCCSTEKKISSRFNIDHNCLSKMRKALVKRMKTNTLNKVLFTQLMEEEGVTREDALSLFELLDLDHNGVLGMQFLIGFLVGTLVDP